MSAACQRGLGGTGHAGIMSTHAIAASAAFPRSAALRSGLFARLGRWFTPTGSNIAWTIGPDGLPCAQWIGPDDAGLR